MVQFEDIKSQIVHFGRQLSEKGLVTGTWGNLSARIPETSFAAVTPSGSNYSKLRPQDIIIVNMEGNIEEGKLKPSSELPMHLAIYRAREDIHAIIHTHSVFASSCAVAHKPIPCLIEDMVQVIGGSVEVARYALPGTAELAENAVFALGNKKAVLMANHGVIGCGISLAEAMLACELTEKAAQIFIYATQLGGANILSNEDVSIMHKFYAEHYRNLQGG